MQRALSLTVEALASQTMVSCIVGAIQTVGGGYVFVPPGVTFADGYLGESLLA